MTTPRRKLTPTQKAEIVARQNGRCAICGGDLLGTVHMDHRIALGLGGADHPDNIQAVCARPCHLLKSKKDVGDIARAKRRKLFMETGRHKKAQSKPIRSRGFPKRPPQNSATRPIQKWAAWREGA